LLAIPLGYLLGSIPSAYLIVKLWKKVSLIGEGDGHISATAAYRKAGRTAFIVTIIMDVGKGFLAIFLASLITQTDWIVLAAGLTSVIGHCWSIFLKFKGGLGATVIYGALTGLSIWFFIISGIVSLIIFLITRRSTFSTAILAVVMSVILLVTKAPLIEILFPYSLVAVQFIKRWQIRKASSEYEGDFLKDLKKK